MSLAKALEIEHIPFMYPIYDKVNKMKYIKTLQSSIRQPDYLLLMLYQLIQYIDENVALTTMGGGRKKSRKHKKRKSKKSRKNRRKSKRHSRR